MGKQQQVDQYYDLLEQMETAKKGKRYRYMLELCEETLSLIPALVRAEKRESGGFVLGVPAIETGLNYWSALGDLDKIRAVDQLVHQFPELGYDDLVQEAYGRVDFTRSILSFLSQNPGYRQNKLPKVIGISGRTVRWIIHYLKNLGCIQRRKVGNTYELFRIPGT